MKWTIAVLSALLAAAGLADGSHDAPPGRLESVAALVDFLARDEPGSRLFSVTGLVSHVDAQAFVLEDGDARVYLLKALAADPAPGARVRVKGNVFVPETDISIPFMLRPEPVVNARQLDVLDQGEPPPPLPLAIGDIDPARHHLATIRTTGTVAEETVDKVDPNYLMLIVEDGDSSLPVSMRRTAAGDGKRFTGAKVEVTGLFWRNLSSVRKFSGPFLTANGPADIRIVSPPAADPLDAPNLEPLRYVSPFMVSHMGRRSVCGRVLATWGPNRLMLLSEDGRAIPVELSGEGPLPEYGARIAVAGRPQTDLFQIKLAAASYRPLADDGKFPAPRTTNLDKVFIYDGGQTFYHAECNGSLVSFEGKVINLPNSLSSPGVMLVDCGRFVVPVDAGTHRQALDGLELGCVVRVTGVCVLEGSVWSTENVLPRIESFRVVVRNADDVGVLARPPWWTPLRLGLAIGVLLAVIAAVLVWNRALNRLAVRRGRKLLREQIGRERATLRLGERTRLAVELHDSLSQCLGGLACQLAASKSLAASSPEKALSCLDAAERMLQSSRTELQRCIFDLRDDTLNDADFSRAIRRAVAPCSGEAAVDVRFVGGRSHIGDSAAHTILCIIRELVSNAARHGRAAKITVVGDNDGRTAAFSVRDDGCGFDVSAQSGPAGGHFGLEGIRERVKRQGGSFRIDSAPGRGTTAFVEINLKADSEETE